MTLFEYISVAINVLMVLFAWQSLRVSRKSLRQSKANAIEIENQKIEIGKIETNNMNDIKFVQEQIKSVAKMRTGDIGGGWAGGVNRNCTSIGNVVEIHQNPTPKQESE